MTPERAAPNVRRAATLGIVLAAVAAALVTACWFLDVYAFDRGIALFDIGEGGLITWSSVSATVAVGVIALLLSFVDPEQRVRGVVLAAGLAYISFDDAVVIHERVADDVARGLGLAEHFGRVLYPLILFPLLITVAYLLLTLGRHDRLVRRLVVAGLVGLAIGVGLDSAEVVLDAADVSDYSWIRVLGSAITEGSELAGWILIATGAAVRLLSLYDPARREG